ncbi:hypothetical protein Rhopal_005867-T1 [Rhodotorula paludigena]|uniref:Proteophosphoglycan ppg4 n=1 Tax=Rhodotorula paludigena TaxID=86838 RepID=A0AAV5GQN1_9BASI|nr:hypothetical protein Rhopal_005867-T1 [Rhodotorula paludigena]
MDSAATEWVSRDLSVRVRGRLVARPDPERTEGIELELDDAEGISIRYPQLVSVETKPESQTLASINSGERLLTLATPLLPPDSDTDADDAAIDDEGEGEGEGAQTATPTPKRAVVTLHDGLVPASEAPSIRQSALFSSTFDILIDSPSFPPPHFDPASLTPPTPSVRAHDAAHSQHHPTALPHNLLNSPLQRALLSPLLSPQRRAANHTPLSAAAGAGGAGDVPPLSLGLSRTSRPSFTGERPSIPHVAQGLAALVPALAPLSSGSAAPDASTTLASTLTSSLSAAAKRTAEELVALRRAHDAHVRRAKAELELLEARIEAARGEKGAADEGGVVRGFKTRDERDRERERTVDARGSGSVSRSRERGASGERARGSQQPSSSSSSAAAATAAPNGSRRTDKDEDVSSLIRAQDEREEDERGRSRSRSRRGDEPPRGTSASQRRAAGQQQPQQQRSASRTKGVAEATAKAVEGAQRRAESGSRERGRDEGTQARGRAHTKGETIPATLEEDAEREERGRHEQQQRGRSTGSSSSADAKNGLLSPASAGQPIRPGGATPTFIPTAHSLMAIPESEEFSLPPSEAGEDDKPPASAPSAAPSEDGEGDAPFEMDEDVDVEELDLASPSRPPPSERLNSATFEMLDGETPPPGPVPTAEQQEQQAPVSSSFRPGSFARASALSASYNALLASSTRGNASSRSAAPVSPSITATRAHASPTLSGVRDPQGLPPFSPPDAPSATVTSAREDAQSALQAATFEHTRLSGGRRSGPDPRDVRRGEQKIRDVLAMDVPSHRPRSGFKRRASVSGSHAGAASAARRDAERDDDEDESEEDDTVDELRSSTAGLGMASPPPSTAPSKLQVGSLPIALGRPSAVNAALSSWRPDPERLWAQARERKTSQPTPREGLWVPSHKSGSAASASPSHAQMLAGGGAALVSGAAPTQPLEIGSPSTPRPGAARGSGAGGATGISGLPLSSSSLARSLRNSPAAMSRRVDAESRNGIEVAPAGQRDEPGRVENDDGADVGDEDDEDDDEDEGFVPPHIVADRRARKDERYLSRSIGTRS